jgi:hypothetical protein
MVSWSAKSEVAGQTRDSARCRHATAAALSMGGDDHVHDASVYPPKPFAAM